VTATSFDRGTRARPLRAALARAFGKWLALVLAFGAVVMLGGPRLLSFFHNSQPFAERTVDRTPPAILQALTDLHDYRAASATFDIVVDVEKDARWMPAALRGERKVMMARGSVDAGVDLDGLDASAVAVDPITKAITITLPHASVRRPALDLASTRMVVHQRGLLDRIGSAVGSAPSSDKPMLSLAETKLADAARASDVTTRAEQNTRAMITALVNGLGHANVRVMFADAKPATMSLRFTSAEPPSP
jgi:hypothetical protein